MSVDNAIVVGDIVTVHFNRSDSLCECEVLEKPKYPGDCWVLIDNRTKNIHYVQMFEKITKMRKSSYTSWTHNSVTNAELEEDIADISEDDYDLPF